MRTLAALAFLLPVTMSAAPRITGEQRRFQAVELTFTGPATAEDATPNPFLDYRLTVEFKHRARNVSMLVPGFYAADGNAAETSGSRGSMWRVMWTPPEAGRWEYAVSFRTGAGIAINDEPGTAAAFDGTRGTLDIAPAERTARGILQYTGEHYLRYSGNGKYFLKGGADSPENFLAYEDFDATRDADADSGSYKKVGPFIHRYEPHVRDWRPGDPTWRNGKGKGIIGALNYLASKGVNSVYFLTYNLDGGDGRDTWMWTDANVRDRFDVSKLAQWNIVFDHMTRKGMMLHVVTQETENDRRLGGGPGLNPVRKLYYRELIARFAHHPAIVWNLGEENNTSDDDRKAIAAYIRTLDAYDHPITVHTHNNKGLTFYDGLLGDRGFEATSIQGDMKNYHREAVELRRRSAAAGRKWAIFHDEQPPDSVGVMPDVSDANHDGPRKLALWGNLMGGGSGVEWYFGHAYPHMDINCEDFRSRDRMWDQTRIALDFFQRRVPFDKMEPADDRVSGPAGAHALAQGDRVVLVYLPNGGEATLKLAPGRYSVEWFNPRTGDPARRGADIQGGPSTPIGPPPADPDQDWAALIRAR